HERKIKANAHAVLMSLAVVSTGREKPTLIEVNIKIELALARCELRRELAFIVFVDLAIERAEVFLDLVVETIQFMVQHPAIGLVGRLCSIPCDFRRLVLSDGLSVIAVAKLRSCQECLRIKDRRLV